MSDSPATAQQLLAHFDRISEAPDAIPRLRRFVLDLAVRGKLVEQDPSDEPAARLLSRTHARRPPADGSERPNARGAQAPDHPTTLPSGWTSAPLADIVAILNGRAYAKSELLDAGTPVLRVGNLFTSDHWYYSTLKLESAKYCNEGDLLYAWSASFGPFIWPGPKAIFHYHIWKLAPHSPDDFNKWYLYHFLAHKTREIKEAGHGVSMLHMTKENMERVVVPLPPLAEQHRIVAKVDELMALCDRLETAQTERETRRHRLVAASLNRLNEPAGTDAAAAQPFRDHARFHLRHLPRLTTRPEHIHQLRQTILNLAVRGRLVPQDPNDQPASELLKGMAGTQTTLQPLRRPAAEDAVPFQAPGGWSWVRFGELVTDADAGWSPKSEGFPRSGNHWGVLKVSAVSWNRFLSSENKQLVAGTAPPERAQVHQGDFLISRANTSELVAKSVVVEEEPERLILSDKIIRLQIAATCSKKYLCIVNNHADYARSYYAEEASGTSLSMKNVSRAVIYALPIPLPPLAEQHRIVAKVDELMALCDRLEAQLTTTQTESRRLLEAVLHQALTP